LPSLGNVEISHDLETGRHGWDEATGQRFAVALQHTVLPETHLQAVLLRFDVNVARSQLQGLQKDAIDQIDDW